MPGPSSGPVYCAECDYRFVVAKNDPPWRWLCLQHKRLDAESFVTRDELAHPPYAPCYRVNFGLCPLYHPARGVEESSHDRSE